MLCPTYLIKHQLVRMAPEQIPGQMGCRMTFWDCCHDKHPTQSHFTKYVHDYLYRPLATPNIDWEGFGGLWSTDNAVHPKDPWGPIPTLRIIVCHIIDSLSIKSDSHIIFTIVRSGGCWTSNCTSSITVVTGPSTALLPPSAVCWRFHGLSSSAMSLLK